MPRPRTVKPTYTLVTHTNGRFYVQWWEDGASRRVSCRTTDQGAARRFLAEFEASLATPDRPQRPIVNQVLDGYLHDREPNPQKGVKTIAQCLVSVRRVLGDLPADLVSVERCRHYAAVRRKDGWQGAAAQWKAPGVVSDTTIHKELAHLKAALKWAVKAQWLPTAPEMELPSPRPPRKRWLTRDEAARLMAAAVEPHMRVFIALALYAAARATAILELTWDRVHLDSKRIDFGEGHGKKRRAVVPISPTLLVILQTAYEARRSDYVVEYRGGRVADISEGFKAAVRRAGLKDVTPHVCRHTAATWAAQKGVPLDQIAGFLGNSLAMVDNIYRHHHPDFMTEVADALG